MKQFADEIQKDQATNSSKLFISKTRRFQEDSEETQLLLKLSLMIMESLKGKKTSKNYTT